MSIFTLNNSYALILIYNDDGVVVSFKSAVKQMAMARHKASSLKL